MINSVMIEGFVCNMKSGVSAGGVMWARFTVGFRRKAGVVGFVNCVAYNKIADRLDRAGVRNGSNLLVSGNLRIDEFTRKDGTPATVPGITVNDFDILYRPKKNRSVEDSKEESDFDSGIEKKYDLEEPANSEIETTNTQTESPFAPFV